MASLYIRPALTAGEPPKARPEATASASERERSHCRNYTLAFALRCFNCHTPSAALFVSLGIAGGWSSSGLLMMKYAPQMYRKRHI